MLIQEDYIEVRNPRTDQESLVLIGSSDVYEPFTDDPGTLFRSLRREYGRPVSKVYIDGPEGRAIPIGWVFEKRVPYQDAPKESYLQHTWITLHDKEPVTEVTYFYHHLGGGK